LTLADIANEKVAVNIGGESRIMTRAEIACRKIWEKAMNGDIKAFSEVRSHIEASEKADAERRGVHFTIEYVDPKKPEPTG
jgi:hypothetical protein